MLAPTFYNENPFASSFLPTFSSSPTSSSPMQNQQSYHSTSAPIPIKVARRTPKVDIGPGPAREEENSPSTSPTSPLASSLSSSLPSEPATPSTPPKSSILATKDGASPPRRPSALRIPAPPSTNTTKNQLSASAPNLGTTPSSGCKKVRFDRSLTILPYTCDPSEHNNIDPPSKSIWTKISEAVAGLRVGASPSNNATPTTTTHLSSWPGPATSISTSTPGTAQTSTVGAPPAAEMEEGSIVGFQEWKEAKEKCGWEVKVAAGGYGGACALRRSSA